MSEEIIQACQVKDKYDNTTVLLTYKALLKKGRKVKYYKCDTCDGWHITSMMDYKKPIMSEEVLQSKCILWANNTYPELRFWGILHIANARKASNAFRNKSKALGIRKGFPDIQIILPDGTIFFIELKTTTGKQSKEQKECQEWLKKRGIDCYVIDNEESFKELINKKIKEGYEPVVTKRN